MAPTESFPAQSNNGQHQGATQSSRQTPGGSNRRPYKRQRQGSTPEHSRKGHSGELTASSKSEEHDLKLLSLNVCVVENKLRYPEFTELIKKYHIIGLTETKTDDTDNIQLPDYVTYMKLRQKLTNILSGGIIFLIKNDIAILVKIINIDGEYVLCFKLEKNFFEF